MKRAAPALLGSAVLAVVWLGPLPRLAEASFSAHMLMHMAVVAVAAPLLALSFRDRLPVGGSAPILASLLDLVVIWAWHTPAFHAAARSGGVAMAVEQASFLLVGLFLWLSAFDRSRDPGAGALAGAGALLFTSMHMTLLGVLLALAPLPLFHSEHAAGLPFGFSPAQDREVGGVLMLAVGGSVYLLGGLMLIGSVLRADHRKDP